MLFLTVWSLCHNFSPMPLNRVYPCVFFQHHLSPASFRNRGGNYTCGHILKMESWPMNCSMNALTSDSHNLHAFVTLHVWAEIFRCCQLGQNKYLVSRHRDRYQNWTGSMCLFKLWEVRKFTNKVQIQLDVRTYALNGKELDRHTELLSKQTENVMWAAG